MFHLGLGLFILFSFREKTSRVQQNVKTPAISRGNFIIQDIISDEQIRYPPTTKAIMSKLNPHNIPCIYKKAFERHASETLIKRAGDNDMYAPYDDGEYDEEYRTLGKLLRNLPSLDLTGWCDKPCDKSAKDNKHKFNSDEIYNAVAINRSVACISDAKLANQVNSFKC